MKKTIQYLEAERMAWSRETFTGATAQASLEKLKEEIKEVEEIIENGAINEEYRKKLFEEFADCLMCLFDSAGRIGILPDDIFEAFEQKLAINKARTWAKNPDNSYSHVKGCETAKEFGAVKSVTMRTGPDIKLSLTPINDIHELVAATQHEARIKHKYTVAHDRQYNNEFQLPHAAQMLSVEPMHQEILENPPAGWDMAGWEHMCNKPYKERLIIAAGMLCSEYERVDNG